MQTLMLYKVDETNFYYYDPRISMWYGVDPNGNTLDVTMNGNTKDDIYSLAENRENTKYITINKGKVGLALGDMSKKKNLISWLMIKD